jgi:hypothetical protein
MSNTHITRAEGILFYKGVQHEDPLGASFVPQGSSLLRAFTANFLDAADEAKQFYL